MTDNANLSSFERILLGLDQPANVETTPLHGGSLCPQCGRGRLDYNGLLQLECPDCGFTSAEGGGCT